MWPMFRHCSFHSIFSVLFSLLLDRQCYMQTTDMALCYIIMLFCSYIVIYMCFGSNLRTNTSHVTALCVHIQGFPINTKINIQDTVDNFRIFPFANFYLENPFVVFFLAWSTISFND